MQIQFGPVVQAAQDSTTHHSAGLLHMLHRNHEANATLMTAGLSRSEGLFFTLEAEYLRRWAAGGEDRAGHLRLVLDDPLRDTWLGQLDDLTGRPGVDISEDAFADLLSQRSLHARSPPCRGNTSGEQKGTLSVAAAAGHYDCLSTCRDLRPLRYVVPSRARRPVIRCSTTFR
jgi:hypothetical protein